MTILSYIKLVAETVTAISAAIILLIHLWGKFPSRIKNILKYFAIFIHGTIDYAGNKVYFFNATRFYKEHKEQQQNIVKALTAEYSFEDVLILDKQKLYSKLNETEIIIKTAHRKS